ncbi:MAG: SPOR domain-containing protein [Pseudomonadota bacterium]
MLRYISTTALVFAASIGIADAQSLRDGQQPAEFPPSSFTGKQYVDSRGCVFVRAGFDGAVTWVPRVNRQRDVLCGFAPTFATAPRPEAPVVPDAPRVATAPPAAADPEPRVSAPRPTAEPRPTVSARPTPPPTTRPAPTRVVTAPVVRTPPPTQRVVVQPPAQVVTSGGCPGASALSQQYLTSSRAVRCGPQAEHPGAYATGTVSPGATAPGTVLRVAPPPKIAPPPGYKSAFEEEDRFNPNRGRQTREGFAQMRLVWTAGVPRRLVDQNTGRDVTSLFPGLRFPFISMKQQTRYVAANGWPVSSGVTSAATTRSVTVSTKNTPPTAVAVPSGHRYVQVGTYGTDGNAKAAAARLRQLGLPVVMGKYTKSGRTYKVVLAGPYSNGSALGSALTAARRGGFSDAFTRK